ncbi:MAG: AI-2E family transporter, partial [Bacteroidetes bacterium]|nr:AI-2E family transporter [Bacteroidota bacterium]
MNFTLLTNRIILIATLVLFGFTAWFFSDIVAYLLIAAGIWFVLTPLVNFLDYTGYKGKSLPRWAATLLAMIIFMGVLIGAGSFFIPLVIEQAS